MDAQAGLLTVRSLCPSAEILSEGGQAAVFLPGVQFQAASGRVTRDLLLWPGARDGYATRLFLSAQVPSSIARTWTAFSICGRNWWAISWQGVPANLSWLEMIANHLRAFK